MFLQLPLVRPGPLCLPYENLLGIAGVWSFYRPDALPDFLTHKQLHFNILDFIGAKDDGGGGDNWSYKLYSQIVITSKPTLSFLQAECSSNSVRALKG